MSSKQCFRYTDNAKINTNVIRSTEIDNDFLNQMDSDFEYSNDSISEIKEEGFQDDQDEDDQCQVHEDQDGFLKQSIHPTQYACITFCDDASSR